MLKIPAINKQSRSVVGSVPQRFRVRQGHRLWAGCSKNAKPEITAGGVLLGKDPMTHIKSLPSAGGCTLLARTPSTCFLTRAPWP